MKYLKNQSKYFCFLLAAALLCSNCFQTNADHYHFWQKNSSLQNAIKSSTDNEVFLSALTGTFSKEREKELKQNHTGDFFLNLSAYSKLGKWEVNWYPSQTENSEYSTNVAYKPLLWNATEIYSVNRQTKFNFSGFLPRDFFIWLNQFALLIVKQQEFLIHRDTKPSYIFLCESFGCERRQESESILLEFEFNEKTKSKFPGFYKRIENRLDKSIFDIKIWNREFPEDKITISNLGKTLQFRFPINPRKKIFLNPKSIDILTNIQIRSFGVSFSIEDLLYRLQLQTNTNQDKVAGRFISYASKTLTGNFLYFIPFGVIDFFIPGNLDEYLTNGLTLLVYGSQGNGGAQFKATYTRKNKSQLNEIEVYSEIPRNRFSLFGVDTQKVDPPHLDFFLNWENAILKDYKSN